MVDKDVERSENFKIQIRVSRSTGEHKKRNLEKQLFMVFWKLKPG